MLLIRPDHLGDVLMASPVVELLRKALPEAHLAMMVGPWAAEVARRDPLVDEVVVCPFPGFTRAPKGSPLAPYGLLWRASAELRREGYHAALLLRFDHWWGAWLAALAGLPVRVGHGVRECAPFLTHALEPPARVHWAEQGLRAARRLLEVWGVGGETLDRSPAAVSPPQPRRRGDDSATHPADPAGRAVRWPPLRFGLEEADEAQASSLWGELDLDTGRRVVAFHPGAGSPLKHWPERHWIDLGWTMAAKGMQIVVTGSQAESVMARRIAAAVPGGRVLAGRTPLGTLAAVLRRCDLVVGVDSGPLHLAVAVGTPTVHLFGPSDPAVFGPWGDPAIHRVVASEWPGAPCGRLDLSTPGGSSPPCMGAITPERVARECEEALR